MLSYRKEIFNIFKRSRQSTMRMPIDLLRTPSRQSNFEPTRCTRAQSRFLYIYIYKLNPSKRFIPLEPIKSNESATVHGNPNIETNHRAAD